MPATGDFAIGIKNVCQIQIGSGTDLMVPVGALRVIHYGGTRQKALRGLIRPVAWLLLVLPAHHVAVLNSPEQRQNPHHQIRARSGRFSIFLAGRAARSRLSTQGGQGRAPV